MDQRVLAIRNVQEATTQLEAARELLGTAQRAQRRLPACVDGTDRRGVGEALEHIEWALAYLHEDGDA